MGTQKGQGVFNFMILLANPFFEKDNAKFTEDVEYSESTGLRSFLFEEEYVIIPTIATENI